MHTTHEAETAPPTAVNISVHSGLNLMLSQPHTRVSPKACRRLAAWKSDDTGYKQGTPLGQPATVTAANATVAAGSAATTTAAAGISSSTSSSNGRQAQQRAVVSHPNI